MFKAYPTAIHLHKQSWLLSRIINIPIPDINLVFLSKSQILPRKFCSR